MDRTDNLRRGEVKIRYQRGDALADIEADTGVSVRSITRWAKSEGWKRFSSASQKKMQPPKLRSVAPTRPNVVTVLDLPRTGGSGDGPPQDPPTGNHRSHGRSGGDRGAARDRNELREIDNAIDQVSACLALGDARSTGSLAAALIKLLIYRRTLEPKSVEDLVQIIHEFLDVRDLEIEDLYQALADRIPMQRRA